MAGVSPGFGAQSGSVGSVLYRLLLHHGAYPFKPEPYDQLTVERLAMAVALFTAADQGYIFFPDRMRYGIVCDGPRDWVDQYRLLFQGLSDIDWTSMLPRVADDDEDLMAVLEGASFTSPKYHIRYSFRHVANTLPSSYSKALNGHASIEDLREVVKLVLAMGQPPLLEGRTELARHSLERAVEATLGQFPPQHSTMDWNTFRTAIAESVVGVPPSARVLRWLTPLISHCFF